MVSKLCHRNDDRSSFRKTFKARPVDEESSRIQDPKAAFPVLIAP